MAYIERTYITEQFEDLLHDDKVMNPVVKVLDALEIIDTAPTADVEEVVRCKDCKCWRPFREDPREYSGRTDGTCDNLILFHAAERYMTEAEHYCGYGERKPQKEDKI